MDPDGVLALATRTDQDRDFALFAGRSACPRLNAYGWLTARVRTVADEQGTDG
jgi:hypothetical protein